MIKLNYTPQRSDFKADYIVSNHVLTVKINNLEETFDFSNLEEGIAEEIIAEILPVNPIVSAEKIGDTLNIQVIRFYSEDEKRGV